MQLLKGHGYNRSVYAVCFSPTGGKLASCGLDGTVRLWDLTTGKEATSLPSMGYYTRSVCFSPDGRWLFWPVGRAIQAQEVDGPGQATWRGSHQLGLVNFAPDGRLLAARYGYLPHAGGIDVLDRDSSVWTPWPGSEGCGALTFSPDGRTLATAHTFQIKRAGVRRPIGRQYEHSIILWDVSTRKGQGHLTGHGDAIGTLAFSRDNRHLAAPSGQTLWVWDVTSREPVAQIRVDAMYFKGAAFSPDGRWLATARNDSTVRFYDTSTWSEGPSFDWGIGKVISVAFAPDGMRAACGSAKGRIVVWDVDV